MAQFTPSKKTIKDFNDGEEYRNKIDIPQAETINNIVEAILYAQDNSGGTTMLTEGREGNKELMVNDYFLDVIDVEEDISARIRAISSEPNNNVLSIQTPITTISLFSLEQRENVKLELSVPNPNRLCICEEEKVKNTLKIS